MAILFLGIATATAEDAAPEDHPIFRWQRHFWRHAESNRFAAASAPGVGGVVLLIEKQVRVRVLPFHTLCVQSEAIPTNALGLSPPVNLTVSSTSALSNLCAVADNSGRDGPVYFAACYFSTNGTVLGYRTFGTSDLNAWFRRIGLRIKETEHPAGGCRLTPALRQPR